MSNPQPQPPLYLPPPKCFTCGNTISHLWIDFCIRLQEIGDGATSDLPVRSIGDQKLVQKAVRTVEGQILDDQGVSRYCCRRMILSQPKEQDKVPLPLKEWEKFKKDI